MRNSVVSIFIQDDPSIFECDYSSAGGLNAKRSGNPNGPWGEYNPRPETTPRASAVVHLGSLKAKASDENYCMLDSGANVLVMLLETGNEG